MMNRQLKAAYIKAGHAHDVRTRRWPLQAGGVERQNRTIVTQSITAMHRQTSAKAIASTALTNICLAIFSRTSGTKLDGPVRQDPNSQPNCRAFSNSSGLENLPRAEKSKTGRRPGTIVTTGIYALPTFL